MVSSNNQESTGISEFTGISLARSNFQVSCCKAHSLRRHGFLHHPLSLPWIVGLATQRHGSRLVLVEKTYLRLLCHFNRNSRVFRILGIILHLAKQRIFTLLAHVCLHVPTCLCHISTQFDFGAVRVVKIPYIAVLVSGRAQPITMYAATYTYTNVQKQQHNYR